MVASSKTIVKYLCIEGGGKGSEGKGMQLVSFESNGVRTQVNNRRHTRAVQSTHAHVHTRTRPRTRIRTCTRTRTRTRTRIRTRTCTRTRIQTHHPHESDVFCSFIIVRANPTLMKWICSVGYDVRAQKCREKPKCMHKTSWCE